MQSHEIGPRMVDGHAKTSTRGLRLRQVQCSVTLVVSQACQGRRYIESGRVLHTMSSTKYSYPLLLGWVLSAGDDHRHLSCETNKKQLRLGPSFKVPSQLPELNSTQISRLHAQGGVSERRNWKAVFLTTFRPNPPLDVCHRWQPSRVTPATAVARQTRRPQFGCSRTGGLQTLGTPILHLTCPLSAGKGVRTILDILTRSGPSNG